MSFSRQDSIRRRKKPTTNLFTQTGRELGRGAYGRIFEVDYQGTLCAAKEVHQTLLEHANEGELLKMKNNFLTECRIWQSLRHPHVVQLLKVCCGPSLMGQSTLPIIVMEKMHLSLRGLVEKHSNIPMNVKASILNDVCLGLRYIHSHNPPIIHRDLTPNNVLLTCGLVAKISDMGVAKVLRHDDPKTMTEAPGTADFMPPESLTKRPSYGLSLDVFSFGAVVLYTTTQLWPTPAPWVEINSKRNSLYLSEVERRQDYIKKMAGDASNLKSLVVKCLDNDPMKRPTIAEVSATIKKHKLETEEHIGKPIKWWVNVSSEKQTEEHLQKITLLQTQAKISQLESELKLTKQFMTEKKVMKAYRKFTERRKPVEPRGGKQQTQPQRCSAVHGNSRGHFVRRLSLSIHKYHHQCIHQTPKMLPRSSSYPFIDKLV